MSLPPREVAEALEALADLQREVNTASEVERGQERTSDSEVEVLDRAQEAVDLRRRRFRTQAPVMAPPLVLPVPEVPVVAAVAVDPPTLAREARRRRQAAPAARPRPAGW